MDTGGAVCVGIAGENKTYTQEFYIGGVTDSTYSYTINLRFSDGSVNSVVPDSAQTDANGTLIKWIITENDVFVHGFFEVQLQGTNTDGDVFETEVVTLYADESLRVEDSGFEHPNSETLRLRNDAYSVLSELKILQKTIEENEEKLLETDITKKADKAATLEGYGITDAYTRTQCDKRFGADCTVLFDGNFMPLKLSTDSELSSDFTDGFKDAEYAFISSDVTSVSSGAFSDCTKLTDVYINNEKDAVTISDSAFDSTAVLHYDEDFAVCRSILYALAEVSEHISDSFEQLGAKEDSSLKVSDSREITDEKENYPSISYLSEYYYDFEDVDGIAAKKADLSTTLSGYGITDAYTKTEADSAFAAKSELETLSAEVDEVSDIIESGSVELTTESSLVSSLVCKYQRTGKCVLIQFSFNTSSAVTEQTDVTFSGLPYKNDSQCSGVCVTPVTRLICPVIISSFNTNMTVSLPSGIRNGERIATSVIYKMN